jgi:hypothetical protein
LVWGRSVWHAAASNAAASSVEIEWNLRTGYRVVG